MRLLAPSLILAAALGGCGLFGHPEDRPVEGIQVRGTPEQVTLGELDQLTKNFADRLVARVSTACDAVKRESAGDEEARGEAHHLKLSIALDAYDIVTSPAASQHVPGAAQHVIDLAILTELEAMRWVDERFARDAFGERGGERVADALSKAREDVWDLCARVLKTQQIDSLKTLIQKWREKNPRVEWVSRVRFDVLGRGQEAKGLQEALAAINPVGGATRTVDEVRLTAQEALFFVKRLPTILDWTAEATVSDALAVPKVSALVQSLTATMASVTHAVSSLEQLTEPSSQEPAVNSTIREAREGLEQAKELVKEVRSLEASVHPILQKSQEKALKEPTKPPTDYAEVARDATSLVRETRELAESPRAKANVDELLDRAGHEVSKSGRDLVNLAAWRAVELVILVAVLVAAFKAVRFFIRRRRPRAAAP